MLKHFIALAKNDASLKIANMKPDRGGEYMSKEFNDYLAARGIHHECIAPYTSQQNGVAERKNMIIMEMARCMLKGENLPNMF